MTDTTAPTKIETLTFEHAMGELEALVRRLEEGRISLEDAISAFERGSELRIYCESKLQAAKMRVEKISFTSDGTAKTQPFDEEPNF